MVDDVAVPWDDTQTVTDYTDNELQQSRSVGTAVSDQTYYVHRLRDTYYLTIEDDDEAADPEAISDGFVLDRAFRVGCAAVLDGLIKTETPVTASRRECDVAYAIPPTGWIREQTVPQYDVVDNDDDEYDDPSISFTTFPVVHEIGDDLRNGGHVEGLTELVVIGFEILLGQR